MPRIRTPAKAEAASSDISDDFSSSKSTNQESSSSSSSSTNPPPGGVTFAALAPLIGFSILLGVVVDDVIIDFCNNAEWKKAYYAAHRTASFPTSAFVTIAIVVGFGGFLYNVFVTTSSSSSRGNINGGKSSSSNITSCISEEEVMTTPDGTNKRRGSSRRKSSTSKNVAVCIDSPSLHASTSPPIHNAHPSSSSTTTPFPLLDWRVLLTIGLGLFMHLLFAHSLVPRQDFIAHIVVSDKSRLRTAGQVQEALRVIRQGHLLLFGALVVLVALQVSLLAGGGRRKRG